MRSPAIALGTFALVATSLSAQQPPPPPLPIGPATSAPRQTMEDMLIIPKLDRKAIVASLQLTAPLAVVLDRISAESGVKLSYDAAVPDLHKLASTVKLSNATAEEALVAALKPHALAFKAMFPDGKSALIYPDTPEGRAKYVDLVRTFTIAHADVTSLTVLLNKTFTTGRAGSPEKPRPVIVPNAAAHTISVRTNAFGMAEVEKFIAENDK